jgi:hypothetical protein
VDEAFSSELLESDPDSVDEGLSELLLPLSPPLLIVLALSVVVALTPIGPNPLLTGYSVLFSLAAKLAVLAYALLAAWGLYWVSMRTRSMMWMTPLERRTSDRMMRASAKADEFPLLPPEAEPELDSEAEAEAEAESVDDDDSDNASDGDSDDESVEKDSNADDEEESLSPPEDELKLPPTDTNIPVELVLKLNGWPEAEKNLLELSSVEYTVLPLINYSNGEESTPLSS